MNYEKTIETELPKIRKALERIANVEERRLLLEDRKYQEIMKRRIEDLESENERLRDEIEIERGIDTLVRGCRL